MPPFTFHVMSPFTCEISSSHNITQYPRKLSSFPSLVQIYLIKILLENRFLVTYTAAMFISLLCRFEYSQHDEKTIHEQLLSGSFYCCCQLDHRSMFSHDIYSSNVSQSICNFIPKYFSLFWHMLLKITVLLNFTQSSIAKFPIVWNRYYYV